MELLDGVEPGRQRSVEGRFIRTEIGGVARLDLCQAGGHRLRHGRHRRRAVPQVWIARGAGQPQKPLHVDHLAFRVRRGGFDLGHEVVVAEAVLDDQLSRADGAGDTRAGLERVRVCVRIALDRAGMDIAAADLRDHVRVLVLGTHCGDLSRASGAGAGGAAPGDDCGAQKRD